MRREQRLCATDDFQRVRGGGRSFAHPLLVLYSRRSRDGGRSLVGVTVGRRVGNAVVRNRVRRRVREALRLRYGAIDPGWDIVIVARPGAGDASYRALAAALESLLRRASLLEAEARCEEPSSC